MPFDAHKNLAIATVVTAPSPAASGTSLVVGAGQGARFPAVPFNGTVWPFDMAPDPATAEVWRCTAIAGDTLTLVRAQEGTTARAMVAGDLIAATITAKSLTDIESGVNFPLITTGAVSGTTGTFSGAVSGTTGTFSGTVTAPTHASAAATPLVLAPAGTERGRLHVSGGFSWGSTTDPGAGSLSVAGDLIVTADKSIRRNTNDGADSGYLSVAGGGGASTDRGSYIGLFGNEHPAGLGNLQLLAGGSPTSQIQFYSGPTALRGVIHPSGGFSWGGTSDPGAGCFQVATGANGAVSGQTFTRIVGGDVWIGNAGSSLSQHVRFFNANGQVGSIETTGVTTAYNTSSDARLKTPLRRHTDTDVLRNTVIHDFVWKSDGTAGRGVFAQEAQVVAPFAVSVGTDDVDDEGRLTHPWGVDYSKYVPDLIAGWQQHDRQIEQTRDALLRYIGENVALTNERLTSLEQPSGWSRLIHRVRTAIRRRVFAWKPSWI